MRSDNEGQTVGARSRITGAVVDMIFEPRAGLVNEPVSSREDDEFAARLGGLLRAASGPRRLRLHPLRRSRQS